MLPLGKIAVRRGLLVVLAVIGTAEITSSASAGEPFPRTGFVNDHAHVLSPGDQLPLEAALRNLYNDGHFDIVVVTVNPPPDDVSKSPSTGEKAALLMREWRVGEPTGHGALLLADTRAREATIVAGSSIEILTPEYRQQIVEREILPFFEVGNFRQGVLDGAWTLAEIVAKDAGSKVNRPAFPSFGAPPSGPFPPGSMGLRSLFLILSIAASLFIMRGRRRRRKPTYWNGGGAFGGGPGGFGGRVGGFGGGLGFAPVRR